MPEFLVCPQCKIPLLEKANTLYCENCGIEYAFDGVIYDFLGNQGSYWGEIPLEEMEKALESAKANGWGIAARNIGLKYPGMTEYIMSNSRLDWLFHCLDFSKTSSCLDIGSGWGTLSFGLARYYDEVWSLESVKQRIGFQKIRREQEGIDNIRFIRADWLRLPFPDNSFDLVVANGILEWLGLNDYSRNPRQIQLDFLKEAKRILKPGGCLYIGIENRFGLQAFHGSKDHSGLPFTSLLPRKLADLAVRLFRKTGGEYQHDKRMKEEWKTYRTYTYSLWGYKKLLKEAGLDKADFYWAFSYNIPKYSGRFNDRSFAFLFKLLRNNCSSERNLRSFMISTVSWLPDQIAALVLLLVSPSFLIYAHKDEAGTSFEFQLLQSEAPIYSSVKISGSHGINSKINYFLLKDGKAVSILKFPRYKAGAPSLEIEEEKMKRFNQIEIKRRDIGPKTVFIEPLINGKPCQPYNLSHNQKVLSWLLDFQQKTEKGIWDFKHIAARVTNLSDFLMNTDIDISNELRLQTKERLELFLSSLSEVSLPKNAEHGDFCRGNILIGKDNHVYVIDWEFYQEESEPLFDFTFFILTNCIGEENIPGLLQDNFFNKDKYSSIMDILISEFAQAKGLPAKLVMQAIPYTIVRCLHRAVTEEEDNKHLNIISYIKLLELWNRN